MPKKVKQVTGLYAFGSLGQGASVTYVNGHYSVTVPTDPRWSVLRYRSCIGVGNSPREAVDNAKEYLRATGNRRARRKG